MNERVRAHLAALQEARASRRPQDPFSGVLEAVEAICGAATALESCGGGWGAESLAGLRRAADLLLETDLARVEADTRNRAIVLAPLAAAGNRPLALARLVCRGIGLELRDSSPDVADRYATAAGAVAVAMSHPSAVVPS